MIPLFMLSGPLCFPVCYTAYYSSPYPYHTQWTSHRDRTRLVIYCTVLAASVYPIPFVVTECYLFFANLLACRMKSVGYLNHLELLVI